MEEHRYVIRNPEKLDQYDINTNTAVDFTDFYFGPGRRIRVFPKDKYRALFIKGKTGNKIKEVVPLRMVEKMIDVAPHIVAKEGVGEFMIDGVKAYAEKVNGETQVEIEGPPLSQIPDGWEEIADVYSHTKKDIQKTAQNMQIAESGDNLWNWGYQTPEQIQIFADANPTWSDPRNYLNVGDEYTLPGLQSTQEEINPRDALINNYGFEVYPSGLNDYMRGEGVYPNTLFPIEGTSGGEIGYYLGGSVARGPYTAQAIYDTMVAQPQEQTDAWMEAMASLRRP